MTDLAELVDHVIGVDPDRDRVTAAVVSVTTQGELAAATFPATRRGYGQALRWAKTLTVDERRAWAIESTGSYGAGLAATLAEKGEFVIEFDHPRTRASKDGAKSDSLDAVRAARETLGRKTWATPRSRGLREAHGAHRHRTRRSPGGPPRAHVRTTRRPVHPAPSRHGDRARARRHQTVPAQHGDPDQAADDRMPRTRARDASDRPRDLPRFAQRTGHRHARRRANPHLLVSRRAMP